jgi:hypothetical protein
MEIPATVEFIGRKAFRANTWLSEVIFLADARIRELHGFQQCWSLHRMEIPATVEIIGLGAFDSCDRLSEVLFLADARIREIHGFQACKSLNRMKIPATVQHIDGEAFDRGPSNRELIFPSGTQIKRACGRRVFRAFIVYIDDSDLTLRRREIQLFIHERTVSGKTN